LSITNSGVQQMEYLRAFYCSAMGSVAEGQVYRH
jgi:hypothetical protein